ncbi:MAG: DUF4129 domain-containing protein [Chloroflexi bacterium]|nr:DUF4129 domain-containing protein [Chloroflexota bacterium]
MSFKSYNWLEDGLLSFSLSLMITCWLSSWMLWVRTWSVFSDRGPVLSPLWLAAVLLLSTFLAKALVRRNWSGAKAQWVVGATGLVAVLVFLKAEYYGGDFVFDVRWLADLFWTLSQILQGLPPQLAGLLLGAYLWWRGIASGRESVEFGDILRAFRTGIMMLIALLVLTALFTKGDDFDIIQRQAIPAVLAFFFFSLLALSLSRIEAARAEAAKRQSKDVGFSRDWLLVAVASVVAIVLLGFLVTSIFSFDLASSLLGLLVSTTHLLIWPIYITALVLGFFLQYVIYFVYFLMWAFRVVPEPPRPPSPEISGDTETMRKTAEAQIPPAVIQAIEWLLLAIIIVLLVYAFVRAIVRLQRGERKDDAEETRESLWSWPAFLDGVKAWLRSLRLRLTNWKRRAATAAIASPHRSDPQYRASLSIRQIYQSLLSHASHLGFPRGADETPYEYLRVVVAALPLGREDLLAITEAYVKARYSGEPAEQSEFQVVDMAWARIRTAMGSIEAVQKTTRR